jgi:hypothetical protein
MDPIIPNRLAGRSAVVDLQALLTLHIKYMPLGFMGDGRNMASALADRYARIAAGAEPTVGDGMTARFN